MRWEAWALSDNNEANESFVINTMNENEQDLNLLKHFIKSTTEISYWLILFSSEPLRKQERSFKTCKNFS